MKEKLSPKSRNNGAMRKRWFGAIEEKEERTNAG